MNTTLMNDDDNKLRCFALNNFGEGQHPFAELTNLHLFKAHYIRACLLRCAQSNRVKQQGRDRALALAGL
jgi:hypothetical protein